MKKIFISGISSGLGKALAEIFAETNWTVIGCGRSDVSFANERIHYFNLDISDINAVSDFIIQHDDLLDGLSVLINNASILGMLEKLDRYPPLTWKKVMDINVNGTFYLTQALYPFLKESTMPQIITMSSSVGKEPRVKWGAYSVSKVAIEGFTQILAEENPEFLIYTINPGGLPTRMRHLAFPDEDQSTLPSLQQAAIAIHNFIEFPDPTWRGKHINLREHLTSE
ncbi:MAG: YciK family oxidoreductase [Calditrichia bacterium]